MEEIDFKWIIMFIAVEQDVSCAQISQIRKERSLQYVVVFERYDWDKSMRKLPDCRLRTGHIEIFVDDIRLCTIPLVSDRDSEFFIF